MNERILHLRSLEPRSAGQGSYMAILEAATGLFQQFPSDAITLRDILALSGVSNQTLYNYFPDGRDDVALVLFDRLRRADHEAFSTCTGQLSWDDLREPSEITRALSACLARATVGNLKSKLPLQSALCAYLKAHRHGAAATHCPELEEALRKEVLLRYGSRFSRRALPLVVRLSVRMVHEVAEVAMAHPEFPLEDLESSARKLLRTLLQSGLKGEDPTSGSHPLQAGASTAPIPGAPISASRRQVILDRILRRKR